MSEHAPEATTGRPCAFIEEAYAIDTALCDQFGHNVTYNPNGWLRRT